MEGISGSDVLPADVIIQDSSRPSSHIWWRERGTGAREQVAGPPYHVPDFPGERAELSFAFDGTLP